MAQPHFPTSIETRIKDKNQQHHQRSLPKGQIAKAEISPAVSVPWRLYKLSTDLNVSILTGSNAGSSGITANLMRNKEQLLSYCVAALSYARIYSERSWKPDDIDKIVDIGWNINRRALMKRPMSFEHQNELGDTTDVFYIDSIKFVTLTKASMTTGKFTQDLNSAKEFFRLLLENGQQSCVVEFNKNYFSFWYSDDKYFLFQPMSYRHKSSKCVQFHSFECVEKYLEKMFVEVEPQAEYRFYSVDILKINNQILSGAEILKNFFQDLTGKGSLKTSGMPEGASFGVGSVRRFPHHDHQNFQTSYESLSECKDVLRCPKSLDRSAKVSSVCVAAIVFLRVDKASFWTSDTLSDILALGSKIYKENLKSNPGQTEIRVADIKQKIELRSFQCLIESQQIFFGKVESKLANICDIEQGLSEFFMVHLAGVIDGPNVVAVWKENNYYYMYDAKARNRSGLNLTKEEISSEIGGMSCVTRFQQLKDLAEVYTENVPSKVRQDYYKITHIELKPFLGKKWNQWEVALLGQWCLRGQQCLKSKENIRVSVTALLYSENLSMKSWTPSTIDEIVSTGSGESSDSFDGGIVKEMKVEIVLKEQPSLVVIKQKMFCYVVNELDRNIENDLVKGFTMFFEANKHGIFSFNIKKTWKYFSVWKSSSSWFAFGLHANEDSGDEKKVAKWCALRFTNQIDMVKSLTANIVIRKKQEFSLNSVNLKPEEPKMDRKNMKNYKTLEVSNGCAGILRIGKNFDLIGSEEDDLKNTYNITAVIAMSLIKDCWSWSNYDVWDILKISQKSFSDQFHELRNFFIKIGSTTIKVKEMQTFLAEKESEEELVQVKSEIKTEVKIEKQTPSKTEDIDPLIDEKSVIEGFMKKFEEHDHPNAILKHTSLQLALWKKDGAFFVFDLRDADETGAVKNDEKSKKNCPYVVWFDSMSALLEHIWTSIGETGNGSYEFTSFELKTKVVNSNNKSWYNVSPVDDISNQWMIRSLYGNLKIQYGISSCVIALAFASTLQPSEWNSSMLDSALKYGMRLYKKSIKTNTTELKLNAIVTPFIVGCYEFSFTEALLKCGTNERDVLDDGIDSLFSHNNFGVISSKGYSAAIWQQNQSYFIFDPMLNGMASLTRFSNISLISDHFLSHIRKGMTGVNVFEISKITISRKIFEKKDCPIDLKAISKLTNRLTPINDTVCNMFNTLEWIQFEEKLPTECLLVAACVIKTYNNPEYWTKSIMDEILSLGENILLTTVKKLNLDPDTYRIQPDQIQGVFPFDSKMAVHVRMALFDENAASQPKNQPNAQGNVIPEDQATQIPQDGKVPEAPIDDQLNTPLSKFFELHDNAFLSTPDAAVTAWKQDDRFYLFYCQPVDLNGRITNTDGDSKGELMPFTNLDDLYIFLETVFGGSNQNGKSSSNQNIGSATFEIRSLVIDPVPLEVLHKQCLRDENIDDVSRTNAYSSRLSGPICRCSSIDEEPLAKHATLCLAAIIMSTICDMKTWTDKSLHQIEVIGKALHDDSVMDSQSSQATNLQLPDRLYIEHVEYFLDISTDNTVHDLNEATLTNTMVEELKSSSTVYVTIKSSNELHRFSLIEKYGIFYWYDPNGVDDAKNEIRSSVDCFSTMKFLVGHILELGAILKSNEFTANFVKIQLTPPTQPNPPTQQSQSTQQIQQTQQITQQLP